MRKRRILSLLTALALCLSLLPVTALAEGMGCDGTECGHVAAIGNIHYNSLADAIDAVQANGAETTIKLLSDTIDGTVIEAGKDVVLNLNNKNVNVTSGSSGSGVITVNGKLTIQNGTLTDTVSGKSNYFIYVDGELNIADTATLTSTGYVIYGTSGDAEITTSGDLTSNDADVIYINSGNSLTINGGTITASGSKKSCVVALGGTVTMNDGALVANGSKAYCIMAKNDKVQSVDILGGSLTANGSEGYAVYWNSAGTLTIGKSDGTGPTLTAGDTAIEVKCTSKIVGSGNTSTVKVQGGTLSGAKFTLYQNTSDVASTSFANVALGNVSLRTASSLTACTVNGKLTLSGMTQCDFDRVTFVDGGSLSSGRYYLEDGAVKETPSYTVTFATNDESLGKIGIKSYRFYSQAAGISSSSTASPTGESSRTWSVLDGSEAKVVAVAMPESNSAFVGWFDNARGEGNPIATSTEVTFEADSDGLRNNVSYYAVFKTSEEYNEMVAAANTWVADYDNKTEFTIGSVSDMQSFAYAVNYLNKDFSGKTVKLTASLTYTDTDSFTPIGTETNHFKGTFDGDGKTITGLSCIGTKGSGYIGLFGYVDNATIQNLTLTGVNFDGGYMTGGFAGEANSSSFTNCVITDSTLSNGYFLGGIFGHSSQTCTVNGCRVEDITFNGYWKTGGVTGYADGVTISDTTVTDSSIKNSAMSGALVGHANSGATTITDVAVSGVKDENGEKTLAIGTTYAGGDSRSITVSGDSTNIDAAGLVPSDSKSNVQVSGGDFTFVIPDKYVPGSTDKISVTFKNGEEIVIVHVIDRGGTVTLPAAPTKDNYIFVGWYVDGKKITDETEFTVNTVVNAQWSEIPVANVTLNQYNLSLFVGGTATLTATVEPENATNKTVTWESDDETVATVEDGVVTAIDEGTATITAKAGDMTATCMVTVTRKEYGITAAPDVLDFGSVYSAYWQPDARTVTITNTGNQTVTIVQPVAGDWLVVGDLSAAELDPDETATFTVQPKAGLPIGNYSETIRITGSNDVYEDITVRFAVVERPVSSGGVTLPTHDISVDSGSHGDVEVWPEEAKQGTTVTITATPDKGYEVADVTVTAENGKEITVTDKGNNKYTFMMPGSDVTIEVTFQPVSGDLTITAPAGWVNPYTDVAANAWYYDAVGYATANGLMGGVGSNAFDPSGSMNRAMVWTVIARLAGQSISGSTWAEDARTWAMAQGVSDGTNPDGAVSREELVTMLYRYAGSPAMNVPELALIGNYPDSADVSAWAQNAFAWAISKGIIEGRDGKLAAGEVLTRAEAATILARFHLLTK